MLERQMRLYRRLLDDAEQELTECTRQLERGNLSMLEMTVLESKVRIAGLKINSYIKRIKELESA